MDKSILIIGGTGVISYAVAQEALYAGFKVTCINRGRSHSQILNKEIEVIHSDYKDKDLIKSKLQDRHFGAVLDVLCFKKEDIDYSIDLFKDYCDQYLFFSSAEVYNKSKYTDSVYDETAELRNSLWDYSLNKADCEEEVIKLATIYNIKYTIVRPAITYGNTRIPYGIMPPYGFHGTMIKRIEAKKPIILWDGGMAKAMITRVEDFAKGFVGLLGNPQAYDNTFHICGDEVCNWKQVIDTLGTAIGIDPVYVDIPSYFIAHEVPVYAGQLLGGRAISQCLTNEKLKKAVPAFHQSIKLSEGIQRTVSYYKSHNYLSGIDWSYDAEQDRIIEKWCNTQNIDVRQYNTSFFDYLGNAGIKGYLIYYMNKNPQCVGSRILSKILRTIK